MLLIIDNYDSFTYNLVQRCGELGSEIVVARNDRITPDEACAMEPDRVIVSPGPCTPNEAGQSVALIRRLAGRTKILGVCLGHQCIAVVFGGRVVRASRLMHGKTSMILHDGRGVYAGLPNPFEATRYHSLVAEEDGLPDCLEITARTPEGELMGLRHREHAVEGVQFHPESFLTVEGPRLLRNFLS